MGVWGWIAVIGGGVSLFALLAWRYPRVAEGLGEIGGSIADIGSSDSSDSSGC